MARERQIFLDEPLRHGMHRHEADLVALALDAKMHDTLTALHVAHPEPAQLLAADAVIEQGGQNCAIAHALERVRGRRLDELARLASPSAGVRPSLPFAIGPASRHRPDCRRRRSTLVTVEKDVVTAAQFGALADMPPELEWLDNITNPHTRRALHE
jgi:hypothetical protein